MGFETTPFSTQTCWHIAPASEIVVQILKCPYKWKLGSLYVVKRGSLELGLKQYPCYCCLVAKLCLTPWDSMDCQAPLSSTVSQSLLKFMSIELVMLYNHLILCCPFLLSLSIFPSIRVFSNELSLHIRWPKYWSFSFSISPSKEHSGLISFSTDWFDLLTVQETQESSPALQFKSINSLALSFLNSSTLYIHGQLLVKP